MLFPRLLWTTCSATSAHVLFDVKVVHLGPHEDARELLRRSYIESDEAGLRRVGLKSSFVLDRISGSEGVAADAGVQPCSR